MRHPNDNDLDEEIRSHLAISVRERIARGEDPEGARLAALREFGYVPAIRDSMRRVWYSRWFDAVAALAQDMRIGLRSLLRAKGMAAAVVVTLALGIGANAAIFSVVRGVLLRPLVNRGEDRLLYIRHSALGIGTPNLTFSVPEIADLKSRVTTISTFGDFSTIAFTMVGVGEPRIVKAGVVSGSFFEVMGLRPVLGRLLSASDDRLNAQGAAVLTHRFWTTALNGDPSVIGKEVGLGPRTATIVGVLEPSVPYPADTEIIANIVTSPHHLEATMVTGRTHRMTELFGRLAPDATIAEARADLAAAYAVMVRANPDAYSTKAEMRLTATPLREQITAPARTILLLLLAAAAVVFIIACSNVANLILARSVRREGELAVRAALGAGRGALRRTLLAESLVLCGAGAVLGVLLAGPMVSVVGRYAARFSIRALDVTVDNSVLWVGAALAIAAAVALAYVPKLPAAQSPTGLGLTSGGLRITPGTNRRLRVFATAQIALSFVLLVGAAMLVATLVAMQAASTGFNTRQVLVLDVPAATGDASTKSIDFHQEVTRRISELPGVEGVAVGVFVPWRDVGLMGSVAFTAEGYGPADGEENPRARFRVVSPTFFAVLGVPMLAGRTFTEDDRRGKELVVIVSQSVAQRMFPNGEALNRHMWWTDPYFGPTPLPRRIVGIVADVDDENVVRGPALAVYHPFRQLGVGGRVFVRAAGDPYNLVPSIKRVVRELSPTQPVERAATLEDVRAEILAPDRLNALVISGFAGVAMLIAAVGVAGVLAFSVSARSREFGVRLAIGSTPRSLLVGVLAEGVVIVTIGIVSGVVGGFVLAALASGYFETVRMPGVLPILGAAAVLGGAAVLASLMPAARASRVDVLQALRSE
ncbi:MAG TPA: ADOP family duplicated permease [Vicinamibacterales bacterium]|nr:ADOP family duplicated permease [Vicinamibacterales bacterium]